IVPLVPKLAVMTPARVLPVPMAPIILSPPPALTSTPGFKSRRLAVEACKTPAGRSLRINEGSLPASSGSIALRAASDHFLLRTSSSAVPLASPYSMVFSPVSQKHTSELQSLRHLVCRLLLE